MVELAHEFRDGILGEHKAPPAKHVVAGVKKDENVGAAHGRGDSLDGARLRACVWRVASTVLGGCVVSLLLGLVWILGGLEEIFRAFVPFLECGELLGNGVVGNVKIRGAQ